jgi:glycosyltransferase involved in cell wall biosynthesis
MSRSSGSLLPDRGPVKVLRMIGRLNVGGPAIQAITLTRRMTERGYETALVRGREEPDEGSMDYRARELDVGPVLVPWMRRNPGWRDLPALIVLIRILRRERPQIVHTHAAKGGALGRLATLVAFPRRRARPILVHTYHGHSLTGYFSGRTASVFQRIERLLAPLTDVLIAVSDEVRDELVGLGIATQDRFAVVPLGFDLAPFSASADERHARRDRFRHELGIPDRAPLVTVIARLVPIKRIDRFLRLAVAIAAELPEARFLVVGDGELREALRASPDARALDGRLTWAGFRRDVADVCFASDVVVLTSDNEGTPVSLIEAQAAGTPVVSTRVGGVASVVRAGYIVGRADERELAGVVSAVLGDPELAERAAADSGQVAEQFSLESLVDRLDALYQGALARPRVQ